MDEHSLENPVPKTEAAAEETLARLETNVHELGNSVSALAEHMSTIATHLATLHPVKAVEAVPTAVADTAGNIGNDVGGAVHTGAAVLNVPGAVVEDTLEDTAAATKGISKRMKRGLRWR